MNKRKMILAAVAAGTISAAGIAGLASADSAITKPASLATEIAQKFGLKTADVQSVINQHKTEMQGYREQGYEARLQADVTAGKITAAQESLILAKHDELQTFMESLKGDTPAARKTAMIQEMTSIRAWEKANNIPPGYLGGFGPGRGFGHRFGDGNPPEPQS